MTGPTFSPDGQWMWDGNSWIPAPPQSNVLPESAINQQEVSSVANQTGVEPNQLTQAAPYFDQNQDGVLQQSELQQAAMAISQSPTAPVPVHAPQQPAMQQPAMQPAMQQPAMQQPAMQQQTQGSQQGGIRALPSGPNSNMKIIIAASIIALLLLSVVMIVWVNNASLADDVETIGLSTITTNTDSYSLSSNGIGATDGSYDVIGSFEHDVQSSGIVWSNFNVDIFSPAVGVTHICGSEKNNPLASCIISWQSNIPDYSPYNPYYSGGSVDITEAAAMAARCAGDPFCGTTIYLMENGVDIVNSGNYNSFTIKLNIDYLGDHSSLVIPVGLLDHDGDGVDDYTDTCDNTPSNDNVDSVGCTLVPDTDGDGINDDDDLLASGNAGLRIYVSQLKISDGEMYEDGQRWPCADGYGSVSYNRINDGGPDCDDMSDENPDAGEEGVNWKIPDFTYVLKVDWDCNEIYDEEINMVGTSYYKDKAYQNITLDHATTDERVLSKDIADDLSKVCIAIGVYDWDIVTGESSPLDISSINGSGLSWETYLKSTTFNGDYTRVTEGSDSDDVSNTYPDASVSVRFLVYEFGN